MLQERPFTVYHSQFGTAVSPNHFSTCRRVPMGARSGDRPQHHEENRAPAGDTTGLTPRPFLSKLFTPQRKRGGRGKPAASLFIWRDRLLRYGNDTFFWQCQKESTVFIYSSLSTLQFAILSPSFISPHLVTSHPLLVFSATMSYMAKQ